MLFDSVMLAATCIPTSPEKRRPLSVDALVPEPIFESTHVITIDVPPERVWSWIAQMGAGRAGWYSWDATSRQFTRSVHDEQLRSDPCPGPMRLRVVCDLVADARRQHECPAISKLGVQLSLKTKEDVALRAPVVRNVAGRV